MGLYRRSPVLPNDVVLNEGLGSAELSCLAPEASNRNGHP
jgi:hypothetical protein